MKPLHSKDKWESVVITGTQIWQCHQGIAQVDTSLVPEERYGITLSEGETITFQEGTTVSYRKYSDKPAIINRIEV